MSLLNDDEYKQCRTCLQKDSKMYYVHDIVTISEIEISLAQAISLCTSVEIAVDDSYPQYLCELCKIAIINCYEFRILCEKSDKIFKAQLFEEQNLSVENIPKTLLLETSILDPLIVSHFDESKPIEILELNLNLENHIIYEDFDELKNKIVQKPFDTISFKSKLVSNNILVDQTEQCKEDVIVKSVSDSCAEINTCDECGKVFQNRTNLLKHKKRHIALSTCQYCQYVTTIPAKLAQHMEEQHSDKKTFSCRECGKRFFKTGNLRIHKLVHSGIKSHTCETCGLSFALKGNLNAHRRVHTGEKPYTCGECGKGFSQHSTLRSHEVCHTKKKDHVCLECGAEFSRIGALRNHKKRHQNSRPFACSECEKDFPFKCELTRHMITHSDVRNHVCGVCDKRFNRNSNLRVHMRIHTGETPHVCHMCGKGFIQAHVLRTHLNTHKK